MADETTTRRVAASGSSRRTESQEPDGLTGVKIHEYQAKAILREFGVPVPNGDVADTPAEARAIAAAARRAGGGEGPGARGRARQGRRREAGRRSGRRPRRRRADPRHDAQDAADAARGHQGAQGAGGGGLADRPRALPVDHARPRARAHVVMASQAGRHGHRGGGGDASRRRSSGSGRDPALGLQAFQARKLAFGLGLAGDQFKAGRGADPQPLPRSTSTKDCSLAEINPLVVTKDGRVLALDAKLNFDDNALFRHPDIVALRDVNEEDPLEVEASKYGLNYIKLDGNVGCMVNGAGLAMATMDIVKLAGGEPANFLDVGGGASPEQIENAFRILSSDPSVKAVFINIFGGILRCDRLAEGMIAAVHEARPQAARGRARWRAPTWSRARRCSPSRASTSIMRRRHGRRRAARSWRWRGGEAGDEHPRRQAHARGRAGHHRQGGHLPRRALQGVRHPGRGRRDAGQGRHHPRGLPGLQHGGGGGARRRAPTAR